LNKIILAAQDGVISIRSVDKLDEVTEQNTFKAHNYKDNGVSALAVSHHGHFIYSAGFDGSIYTWAIGDEEAPEIDNEEQVQDDEIEKLQDLELEENDYFDEDVEYYLTTIENEEYKKVEAEREEIQNQLTMDRDNIKQALEKLLNENGYADEIERLGRDEFVIDLKGKEEIE
jgi:hypothetical protein